jgi:non-specific serine/threonine protein kinase
VGKTRLALEVATEVRATFAAGAHLVPLAPLADAALVLPTIAAAVGVREQPGRPLAESLADALRGRHLLLLLDNFEHVLAAAPGVAALLAASPRLRVVVTSRAALRVAGEQEFPVSPLGLPPPAEPGPAARAAGPVAVAGDSGPAAEELGRYEAVRLFVDRAVAVRPSFRLTAENAPAVARICQRVDGLPLALELAAARVRVLPPAQLLARLEDRFRLLTGGSRAAPERQQTLRAAVSWSYHLLTAPEQRLFARLSVFAGGWTLEAAEAVCAGEGVAAPDVLDLLTRLVDESLVVAQDRPDGTARFRLLETLRQFAEERLAAEDTGTAVRARHAAYYLALAERTEPELIGGGGQAAHARLEGEHDNCRTALGWLVARAETERAQRLVGALGRFWFIRGYLAEGEAWTARVLALPGGGRPTAGRAKTLYAAGSMALARGDYAATEGATREAYALWRALGDAAGQGFALFVLGYVARLRGDATGARPLLEAGAAVSRSAGQGAAEANCLWALAELAYDQGDDREARRLAEAALARAARAGWSVGVTVARRVLGAVRARQGEYGASAALLEASLADARALGARWWIAETLAPLGQLAVEQGDLDLAGDRLAESLALARELGDRVGTARALEGLAQLAAVRGAARRALQLAGAAGALRDEAPAPLAPPDRARLEARLAPARRTLGGDAAEAAWVEGAALPLQRVVDLALTGARTPRAGRTAGCGRSA